MAVCGEIEHGGELRVHNLVPLGMPPQPTPFSRTPRAPFRAAGDAGTHTAPRPLPGQRAPSLRRCCCCLACTAAATWTPSWPRCLWTSWLATRVRSGCVSSWLHAAAAALMVPLVQEQAESARIARVIVAGNCVQPARAAAGDKVGGHLAALLLRQPPARPHLPLTRAPLRPAADSQRASRAGRAGAGAGHVAGGAGGGSARGCDAGATRPLQPLVAAAAAAPLPAAARRQVLLHARCLQPVPLLHRRRHVRRAHRPPPLPVLTPCPACGMRRFLGHSGQPVEDVAKYTRGLSRLQILRSTLQWRHLAPTAPDTLGVCSIRSRTCVSAPLMRRSAARSMLPICGHGSVCDQGGSARHVCRQPARVRHRVAARYAATTCTCFTTIATACGTERGCSQGRTDRQPGWYACQSSQSRGKLCCWTCSLWSASCCSSAASAMRCESEVWQCRGNVGAQAPLLLITAPSTR